MLVLIATIILFTISAATSLYSLRKTSRLVSDSMPMTIWTISQLEREYGNYWLTLSLYDAGVRSHDELILAYEILWNRLEVALHADEAVQLRELENSEETLRELFNHIQATEDAHLNLKAPTDPTVDELIARFSSFKQRLYNIALANFNDNDRLYGLDLVASAFRTSGLYLIGLLLSGSILVLLLLREGRRSQHNAMHDSLTALPNRAYFTRHLNQVIALAQRDNRQAAVFLIDLNDFKDVNDSLGHNAGDELLKGVSHRLQQMTRDSDLVARLGGDEFALVLYPAESRSQVSEFATRMNRRLSEEIKLTEGHCVPSASIGISLYPEDSDTPQQLLINADMAMYQTKQHRTAGFTFYDNKLLCHQQRRKQLGQDLRVLLDKEPEQQLELFYQPVLDLATRQIVAVEALLRWHHPELGDVSPPEAIATAEQYNLADSLGHWILARACQQLASWQQLDGYRDFRVSVNISPGMYRSGNLSKAIAILLKRYQILPSRLMLEVTEDTTMQDLGWNSHILRQLNALGVRLAMDDFGTGHSSLSHLSQLPVDVLKIDRSFVLTWRERQENLSVLRAIIQLGKTLNLQIIAEGIEHQSDHDLLLAEGCQMGQGYHFSRPIPAAALTQLLKEQPVVLPP